MNKATGIALAVEKAGGSKALADKLGESHQTVCNWIARGQPPANKCWAIQEATGVERRELRPDDWHEYWPETKAA